MRSRRGRGWIAITLLCTLVIPAVGSGAASKKKRLQRTEARLDEVNDRLDRHQSQARSLRENIDALSAQLTKIQIEINALDARIARVSSEVRSAMARIKRTQSEIDAVRDLATRQAVALYEAGSTQTIDALLSAESLSDLDSRAEMLGIAAAQNTGALIRYGRLRHQIEEQNSILLGKKEELEAQLGRRSSLASDLQEKRSQIAANLEKIHGRIDEEKHHEAELTEDSRRLRAALLSSQATSAVRALGTSAQGFIWPVNGMITSSYGPRWESFHPGLDIDCYTGQPIVASKSGQVLSAAYSGGYGNLTVVDHGGGVTTAYAHQNSFGTSPGASVGQGEVIGYCGSTGYSTGSHLHFEVRINGATQNPATYLP